MLSDFYRFGRDPESEVIAAHHNIRIRRMLARPLIQPIIVGDGGTPKMKNVRLVKHKSHTPDSYTLLIVKCVGIITFVGSTRLIQKRRC